METVLDRREEIYNYFHSNCEAYFFDAAHEEEFVAYRNSMYLLQDTTESLWKHRKRGFAAEPLFAYLEFWGIMQAAIIQQDAIKELYQVMFRRKLDESAHNLSAWRSVRELRNVCAGHPARKDKPKQIVVRSFMGRRFGDYKDFSYERWERGVGSTHPHVQLGVLLDAYAAEAEQQLATILGEMNTRWP